METTGMERRKMEGREMKGRKMERREMEIGGALTGGHQAACFAPAFHFGEVTFNGN
jgi:hypothetical protein